MVSEALSCLRNRAMLNEITTKKAYEDFYKDKIPEDVYITLMEGTTQMTPVHKLACDHIAKAYANGDEALAKKILLLIHNFWPAASQEARQYAVKVCKNSSETLAENVDVFIYKISTISKMKSHSEGSYIERGFEVLYETERIRITCTKSYSSSCHHYGKSHWCTASDLFGKHDGFEMFHHYTVDSQSVLIQFVIKENMGKTFQVQISVNGCEIINVNDWEDEILFVDEVQDTLTSVGENLGVIMSTVIRPNIKRLYNETCELYSDEAVYYEGRRRERVEGLYNRFLTALRSDKALDVATRAMRTKTVIREDGFVAAFNPNFRNYSPLTFIDVGFKGLTNAEKNFYENYMTDDSCEIAYEFGIMPTEATYVFDSNGNFINVFIGDISIINEHFTFITDFEDEYLEECNINYVINTQTGQIMFKNVRPVSCDGCDEYFYDLAEKLGQNTVEDIIKGDFNDGEFFVIADVNKKCAYGLNQVTGMVVEIPYLENYFDTPEYPPRQY